MQSWLSKRNFCVSLICTQLSDCLAAFSHHIPALPLMCFSLTTKRQKEQKKASAQKRHGFTVSTCQKVTSTSRRRNQCELNIVSQSLTGGITVRKLWILKTTTISHVVSLHSSLLTWIAISTSASSRRTRKKSCHQQNCLPIITRNVLHLTTR